MFKNSKVKKSLSILTLTLFLHHPLLWAQPKADSFPDYKIGSGAKYELNVGGSPSNVTMAVLSRTKNRLVIEILIESTGDNQALGIKMWQQFHMRLVGGKIQIEKGIMKIPQIAKPQVFPNEYLQGFSGVQMRSFLINSDSEITGKKISSEKISVGGQTFDAQHYKHSENNQSVEFWLANTAKPFGLVQMTSSGGQSGQTYKMTFQNTVTNYQPKIDASLAEPLNEAAKMFLPLLGPGLFRD